MLAKNYRLILRDTDQDVLKSTVQPVRLSVEYHRLIQLQKYTHITWNIVKKNNYFQENKYFGISNSVTTPKLVDIIEIMKVVSKKSCKFQYIFRNSVETFPKKPP